MEMQMGKASDHQRAVDAHYQVESEIMSHVRNMTLQGKKKLADKMAQHTSEAEKAAKQNG